MEHILRPIYQERASQTNTLGVILMDKKADAEIVTDTFDTVLLIIVKEAKEAIFSKHYLYENKKMVMHIVTEERLRKWMLLGRNKKMVDWILLGKILFDRNEYLYHLRLELQDFPLYGRKVKKGIQFAKLIRRYLEGKKFFEAKKYLDAYSYVIDSLHYLGRMAVIEHGLYPEVTVWSQVKKIEPTVYKLYEELVTSSESIDKRLELLFLASELLIHSRTVDGAQHILEVMMEKEQWTIQELHSHEKLVIYSIDLEVFIEYLIDKNYIVVEPVIAKNSAIYHRHYRVDKDFVRFQYD